MKIGITFWSILLILTGTYFRTKSGQDIEAKELDFLIIIQLFVSSIGAIYSIYILLKEKKIGPSSILLIGFVIFAGVSALLTPLYTKVIGYWILLAGSALITMAITQSSKNSSHVELVEKTWLTLILLIIVKDSLISLLIPGMGNEWSGDRLAMGLTHANTIGFYAALSFWMLYRQKNYIPPFFTWLIRVLLILVIILAQSRTSMIAVIVGGIVILFFAFSEDQEHGTVKKLFGLGLIFSVFLLFILLYALEVKFVQDLFSDFNRGQNLNDISNLTGRTQVWAIAISNIINNPLQFLFGHGYGVSSYVLNLSNIAPTWHIFHSHNDFIEIFLNVGLAGFVFFMFLLFRSFIFLFNYNSLQRYFSTDFIIRAASVITMISFHSITEVNFGAKIDPVVLISIFYMLVPDLKKHWVPKTAHIS